MSTARVGCSGWVYKHWRGPVYPHDLPSKKWFEHYAAMFNSVEINNSFYRLPTEAAAEGWAAQAPPGFVYALKLGQFGSHRMKLKDAASWLPNHLDRVERMGATAGPTLVQLHDETYEVLRRHGAALCIHDLLDQHPWELTTDWTYVRFHGPHATQAAYQGRYGPDGLYWMSERLSSWLEEGYDVYAYFNNDDSGFAVEDARWLADRLGHGNS
jgi:uncharacterized protein YecE (DUF72 family)